MYKILFFSLLLILLVFRIALSSSYQKSYGDQSPNIIAGGDVKIEYNNKQKITEISLKFEKKINTEINAISTILKNKDISEHKRKQLQILLSFLGELKNINGKYQNTNIKRKKCFLKADEFGSFFSMQKEIFYQKCKDLFSE